MVLGGIRWLALRSTVLLATGCTLLLSAINTPAQQVEALGTGNWSVRPAMPTYARELHTATPIGDGSELLIVGGYSGSIYPADALRYDPATQSYSSAGTLAFGRAFHSATVLSDDDPSTDDDVLVAGGQNSSGYLATAERYVASSNTWVSAGSMSSNRYGHTATRLLDGRILVAGGTPDGASAIATAEIYDPVTNAWTIVSSMSAARAGHVASLLPNGRVLVAGGFGVGGFPDPVASAEIYDPAANAWGPAGALSQARGGQAAVVLADGDALVIGGYTGASASTAVDRYDSTTGTWTVPTSLPGGRFQHTATVLGNGAVLVSGGSNGATVQATQIYDPFGNTWTSSNAMLTPRFRHTATRLPDATVIVIGGFEGSVRLQSVEAFDPGVWETPLAMTSAREGHTASLLEDGRVLLVGGSSGLGCLSSAELFDPVLESFSAAASMTTARCEHTATLLGDGRVLVAGGHSGSGVALASAEIYDPTSNSWSSGGIMSTARRRHTATLLPYESAAFTGDDKVLVAGGESGGSTLASAELYNPATNIWGVTGGMATARQEHIALGLSETVVLVAGGFNGGVLSSAELYVYGANGWLPAPSMAGARTRAATALLPDRRALVSGGSTGLASTNTAEVYDPLANTWSSTGLMSASREELALVTLSNGTVLAAGGESAGGPISDTERYDAVENAWTDTAPMSTPRTRARATLLLDGKALITGGGTGVGTSSAAQVYDLDARLATPASRFMRPVACDPSTSSCFYVNYVDEDPGRALFETKDYMCQSGIFAQVYEGHSGTDLVIDDFAQMNAGVPVVAADGGLVVSTHDGEPDYPNDPQRPNYVLIMHPSGVLTWSAHLREGSIVVRPGDQVTRGQKLALVGNSGSSTWPHLHFHVLDFAIHAVDPWKNDSGPNCGGAASLWETQDPYLTAFKRIRDFLMVETPTFSGPPPNGLIHGAAPLGALPSGAPQLCSAILLLNLYAGDTSEFRFIDPAGVVRATSSTTAPGYAHFWYQSACAPASTLTPYVGQWHVEYWHKTASDPFLALENSRAFCVGTGPDDGDCDGKLNSMDNCASTYNPLQENIDRNFIDNSPPYAASTDDRTRANSDVAGDACDEDDDNDGLTDTTEAASPPCASASAKTNPLIPDSDGDRFLDGAECALSTDPANSGSKPLAAACGTTADPDGDKLNNRAEFCFYNTNPNLADTDADTTDGTPSGLTKDGCEVASLNADRIVNSLDQAMLAQGILSVVPYTVNVDINKDGVLNSIDQGLQAQYILPAGQCP